MQQLFQQTYEKVLKLKKLSLTIKLVILKLKTSNTAINLKF